MSDENISAESVPNEENTAVNPEAKSRIDTVKEAVTTFKDVAVTKAEELKAAAAAKADELKAAGTAKYTELKNVGTTKFQDAKAAATAKYNEAKTAFDAKKAELTEQGKVQFAQARTKAQEFQADGTAYVKENPTQAILIALGIGFLIGLLLRGEKK